MDDIKNVVSIEKPVSSKTTVSVSMPGSAQTVRSSSTTLPIRYRGLLVLRQHTGHGSLRTSLLM